MSAAVADYDGDGLMDIFVPNDKLLASGFASLSNPIAGYSPNIADFDYDGWKDVFVSRGTCSRRP